MPLRTKVRLRDSVYDIPRFSRAYELRKKNGKKTPRKACRSVSKAPKPHQQNESIQGTKLTKNDPTSSKLNAPSLNTLTSNSGPFFLTTLLILPHPNATANVPN